MTRLILAALLIPFLSLAASAKPPTVLATIKPVQSLAAAVMAGVGTPELLIGGAASEHTYVLKPSDAEKIAGATLIFWIGPDLETFLAGPLRNLAPDAKIVALETAPGLTRYTARDAGLWSSPPQRANGGALNPHIWLDPDNAEAMVRAIATNLAQADPANALRYRANAESEIAHLKALDGQLQAELAGVQHRPFLVYHDAYLYFTEHYHLDAVGAVTVEPGRPVGPRRIAELHDAVKARRAGCVFREPQFPPALLKTITDGTAARTGILDPIGADLPAGPGLYPRLMQGLAHSFVACLALAPAGKGMP